jgi:hypothetical protein
MYKAILIAALLSGFSGTANAEGEPRIIAAGEWSKPVSDSRGYAIRGRLVLCEKPRSDELRETPLYVELQDASESIGNDMLLYCDMGKHDFRPEYKGGLTCELKDEDDRAIESKSFPFGGGVPKSQWVTLTVDGTVRLRATPFGIRREKAISICPHLNVLWVINQDDPAVHYLNGTLTIDPPKGAEEASKGYVWRGTIALPPMKIATAMK